jgi:hypothetical protein
MYLEHYLLIVICVLLFGLLSPNIVYLIHKKHFMWKNVNMWGYSTPKQYRFGVGTIVIALDNKKEYKILENGRHDYLICLTNGEGDCRIVLQNQIKLK